MLQQIPSPRPPAQLPAIHRKMSELRFTMAGSDGVGQLLRTLVAAKPGGRFLELGTGLGLSLAWMVDGMGPSATVLSVDDQLVYIDFVKDLFAKDERVELLRTDGAKWLEDYDGPGFDLIFADTWPGKYDHLEEALDTLNAGGWYVLDDMLPQDNWPEGHAAKVKNLTATLAARSDLHLCLLPWATGVILAVKK